MATNEGVADNAFLKEEYFFLQKTYEDFDSKSITIKTWSVSGSLVLIGAGFSEKGSAELFCIGAIASLFFWVIEAYWKGFQYAFLRRIKTIEAYFTNTEKSILPPLQISTDWNLDWHTVGKRRVWKRIIWWPTVMLPHLVLFIGGITLYILTYIGIVHIPTHC
jgi:hypothetical protein